MIVHIASLTFSGVDIIDVDIQVQITTGIPAFTIVGLADKTIAESRERVRAALSSIGLALPAKKILINLAPADLVKEGSHFDLAIACAILCSMNILPKEELSEYLIIGELSLDGTVVPVCGVLPASIGALERGKGLICSKKNGSEAAWSGNENILAPSNLIELINHFKNTQILSKPEIIIDNSSPIYPDFKDIKGQDMAKRVCEIAASGGHNLLMSGPPGTGKSMLAQRMVGILPPMLPREILESSIINSISGSIENGTLSKNRPFRAPHHSCSMAAMVGGGVGKKVKPGEISLAHNGILFLDELPEFPNNVIEALRQPIETGEILIARANAHIKYQANFQLIAAMNPCKCGYITELDKSCNKAPKCGVDYQNRISGPIMDRFDLKIEVANISAYNYHFLKNDKAESTEEISKRVHSVRSLQLKRYDAYNITTNNRLDGELLVSYATPCNDGLALLNDAANKFKLSVRSYNRILRVARTIADMSQSKNIYKIHIAEALTYRNI
jgi:magnesium chelatase family protein